MEIGININENNEVTVWYYNTPDGDIRINIDETIIEGIKSGYLYKYINGELIRDTSKEQLILNQIEVEQLLKQLDDTQWVVGEITEANITGESYPTYYNEIIEQRKGWKARLSELGIV